MTAVCPFDNDYPFGMYNTCFSNLHSLAVKRTVADSLVHNSRQKHLAQKPFPVEIPAWRRIPFGSSLLGPQKEIVRMKYGAGESLGYFPSGCSLPRSAAAVYRENGSAFLIDNSLCLRLYIIDQFVVSPHTYASFQGIYISIFQSRDCVNMKLLRRY